MTTAKGLFTQSSLFSMDDIKKAGLTLTGTILNKQLIKLTDSVRLAFMLLSKNEKGKESGIECYALGILAHNMNRGLPNNSKARVHFAQHKNSPEKFLARRAIDYTLLELPPPEDVPSEEARKVPTAWGLWREGQGWFRNLKPGTSLGRAPVVFVEDQRQAKHYVLFQDCKDQQTTLAMAFGSRTTIKPIAFNEPNSH